MEAAEAGRPTIECIHPNKKPKRPAKVGIFAAGFWNHGTQFRKAQGAEKRECAPGNPGGKYNGNGLRFGCHLAGLQKNSRADHGADDNGSGRPRAKRSNEFGAAFWFCGRSDGVLQPA